MDTSPSLTFGDVLLRPRYSDIRSRARISLRSRLIGDIYLNLPMLSSNMDTVTEHKMAIAMALNGGAGVLHRYMTPDQQVDEVLKVKRFTNFIVLNPHTVRNDTTITQLLDDIIPTTGYSCFPVLDQNNKLVGMVTKHQYQLLQKGALGNRMVSDFMVPRDKLIVVYDPKIPLDDAIKVMQDTGVNKLLIITKEEELVGLITSKDIVLRRTLVNATVDKNFQLVVGAALGVKADDYLERTEKLIKAGVDFVVMDVAHGHHVLVKDAISDLKKRYPSLLIMAGNVCTSEGVQFLIDCGADCIKVGVGNGSICSTRMKTGCGVPQLSALMDCFTVAKKANIPIVGDGGHSGKVGNIFKAIALGGCSACMLGRFLAGTTESPGDIIMKDGKRVKVIRGMASYTANMNRSKGSNRLNIEGTEGIVPYKGDVKGVLDEIEDGVKSGMSYLGCTSIDQLRAESEAGNIKYSVLTKSGQDESGYHDIHVI